MEESFEAEVTRLWNLVEGDLVAKLYTFCHGVRDWARSVRVDQSKLKHELARKLEMLIEVNRTDEVLDDLHNTRIRLN